MPAQNDNEMESFAHEALKTFALTHNYNRWVCDNFIQYISGKCVLEVGCGTGNLTRRFMGHCSRIIGIDTSDLFMRHLKIDFPELEIYNFDISDERVKTLSEKGIEAVVAVNVLEHVKEDEKALRNMRDILQPGGRLLLFVPALSWLFGTMDETVSHHRRYDKDELARKVADNGFTVEKIFFSNFLGIFGWYLNGRILKKKHFPIIQPLIFDKLVPLLSKLEKIFKPAIGMNLTVIARKNG